MVLVIAALGVVLQATFTTTMGFGSEREGRTWDVLLTTPMSPSRIVWGKLAGALRSLWFFPTVAMAHMVLAVAAGGAHPVLIVHAGLILLGPAALLSGVGTSLSLRLRRGASAAVLNLALALGLWALSWVVLAIVSDALRLMGERDLRDRLEAVLFCINPVAMAVSACEGGGARRGGMRYEIPGIGSHVGMGTFTLVVLGVAVGYVGLAWGAARLAIARFVRWAPRAS
jgi:ABC-type transport system involved in multi-copper enzyme maturation permease subunit